MTIRRVVWLAPLFLLSCAVLKALSPPEETLTTSYKKPLGPTLDGDKVPFAEEPMSLALQPRAPDGSFLLSPGSYEMTTPSFCLHAGKGGGGRKTAYLAAKLEGPRAKIVNKILERAAFHLWGSNEGDLRQEDVQLIVWAVIDQAKLDPNGKLGPALSILMTPEEIKKLNDDRLEVFSGTIVKRMQKSLPKEARDAIDRQNQMRAKFESGQASYEEMAALAVPSTGDEGPGVGLWTRTPEGYLVRFFPQGFSKTKLQIYVEEKKDDKQEGKTSFLGGGGGSPFLFAAPGGNAPAAPASGGEGESCTKADVGHLVAAPNDSNRQRLAMMTERNSGVGALKDAKDDAEIHGALKKVANACERLVNHDEGYGPTNPVPSNECARLGTLKHKCAEDSINEAQNPRVNSEVAYTNRGKPLPPKNTPEGNKCRGKVFNDLVNKKGWDEKKYGTYKTAECGGYMCADVVVGKEGAADLGKKNVSNAYDFKFPCGDNKPKMDEDQLRKYKKVFGAEPGLISPGMP
jgi:hypothetical protein